MSHDPAIDPRDDATTAPDARHAADTAEATRARTRARVNQAIDKASAKLHSLRDDLQPTIESLSAQVHELTARGKAAAADARQQTRETLSDVAEQTSAYVAEKPFKSMAIAAAAGAALALLLGRRR